MPGRVINLRNARMRIKLEQALRAMRGRVSSAQYKRWEEYLRLKHREN